MQDRSSENSFRDPLSGRLGLVGYPKKSSQSISDKSRKVIRVLTLTWLLEHVATAERENIRAS